jgi:hypothetical protein
MELFTSKKKNNTLKKIMDEVWDFGYMWSVSH